jgi:hypothetical protein
MIIGNWLANEKAGEKFLFYAKRITPSLQKRG